MGSFPLMAEGELCTARSCRTLQEALRDHQSGSEPFFRESHRQQWQFDHIAPLWRLSPPFP